MKYKFNGTFEGLGFIKELLREFNLPRVQVATDDTVLYDHVLYIKGLYLYRYNEHDDRLIKVRNYYYNKPILNLTTKMNLTSPYYNSDFHEYLGNYLRFIRDYKHLNLMPLYNCFSNRVIRHKDWDDLYDYYAVPVKFNQPYMIGLDSSTPIDIWCTLWNNTFVVGDNNTKITEKALEQLEKITFRRLPSCQINKPILYDNLVNFKKYSMSIINIKSRSVDPEFNQKEFVSQFINHFNDLRLIIKVPKSNTSSITVLEGNYTFNTIIDNTVTTKMIHGTKEGKYYLRSYPTNLSLFSVNDDKKHPFADRLIEYLLDEAVTNLDNLPDNIKRVQEYLISLRQIGPKTLYGVWDERMNETIYDILNFSRVNEVNFIKDKKNKIYKLKLTNEGLVKNGLYYKDQMRNLIDVRNDLLTYMDKDVEELFLSTDVNDSYTR